MKTNRDNGKTSEYDHAKIFRKHCEIWSLADGVDREKLKKQLVQELEHMIETPREYISGERGEKWGSFVGCDQRWFEHKTEILKRRFRKRLWVECL